MPLNKTYFLDPYGCAKNQVDAENLMAYLDAANWKRSLDADKADLVIVNSCGFIAKAKQESINAVLEHKDKGHRVLLAGCLAQRYGAELHESLTEADGIFGNKDLAQIVRVADAVVEGKRPLVLSTAPATEPSLAVTAKRPLLSDSGTAYVKITEGCNNCCAFCSIPLIRGPLKSRAIEDIVTECQTLLSRGIKELCLVGQDTAAFGLDTEGKQKLPELLHALLELRETNSNFWLRLLYLHPEHFPDILGLFKENQDILLPYFDVPFQHAAPGLLQKMNRRGSDKTYLDLLSWIRDSVPEAVLRSTFLLGFPGETESDIEILVDFLEKARLDWVGCFTYSREEGTAAYGMKPRVPKRVAGLRRRLIEEKQVPITEARLDRFLGQRFKVLIEEKIGEALYVGRIFAQAPEVDGAVIVSGTGLPLRGFAMCEVKARTGFDLCALRG